MLAGSLDAYARCTEGFIIRFGIVTVGFQRIYYGFDISAIFYLVKIAAVAAPDFVHLAGKHATRLVDESYVVAQFLDRSHVVGGEYDGASFVAQR